jgi:hypothetical protein
MSAAVMAQPDDRIIERLMAELRLGNREAAGELMEFLWPDLRRRCAGNAPTTPGSRQPCWMSYVLRFALRSSREGRSDRTWEGDSKIEDLVNGSRLPDPMKVLQKLLRRSAFNSAMASGANRID